MTTHASVQFHEVIIGGLTIRFPFEPYAAQRAYMASVVRALQTSSHALLESPTGTGKTLCLLCTVGAWVKSKRSPEDPNGSKAPVVYYASRTHAQLAHVVKEFVRTSYANDLTMAVLGSREHLCVHAQVTAAPAATQAYQCGALRTDQRCRFFKGTPKYMANEQMRVTTGEIRNRNLHDIEDLCQLGRTENFCPYFYERELAKAADIIFLPYAYIFDSTMHSQLPVPLEGAVLIVDEAHNVPSALTSACSMSLTAVDTAAAMRDLDRVVRVMESRLAKADKGEDSDRSVTLVTKGAGRDRHAAGRDPEAREAVVVDAAHFAALAAAAKLVIHALEAAIAEEVFPNPAATEVERPGSYMATFLARPGVDITPSTFFGGTGCLSSILLTAVNLLSAQSELGLSSLSGTGVTKIHDFLLAALAPGLRPEEVDHSCRFVLQEERDGGHVRGAIAHSAQSGAHALSRRTLGFWCMDVGAPMRALCGTVRQALLTSGTLSPMAHFAAELGTRFEVVHEGQHVIDPRTQLRSFVLTAGPAGDPLNGSYAFRTSAAYHAALGYSVVNLAAVVPDGLIVFFPSYAAMGAATDAWKRVLPGADGSTIWGQLCEHKQTFVEPVVSAELAPVITEYQAACLRRKGAVLFGVARGKISEGVDFADRHARCVIVTGIPFANRTDLFIRVKCAFLSSVAADRPRVDGRLFTGDDWYRNEALRAVNQCIGRVIRHHRDYGCIVLADERFRQHIPALSSWATRDGDGHTLIQTTKFADCFRDVVSFFKGFRQNAAATVAPSEGGGGGAAQTPAVSCVSDASIAGATAYFRLATPDVAAATEPPTAGSDAQSSLDMALRSSFKYTNLFASAKPAAAAVPSSKAESTAEHVPPPPTAGPQSRELVAQLRTALPAAAYAEFKHHLERLVKLRRAPNTATDVVVAELQSILLIFRSHIAACGAHAYAVQFRCFVPAALAARYDELVSGLVPAGP